MLENITLQEKEVIKLKTVAGFPSLPLPPSNTSPLPNGLNIPLPLPPPHCPLPYGALGNYGRRDNGQITSTPTALPTLPCYR